MPRIQWYIAYMKGIRSKWVVLSVQRGCLKAPHLSRTGKKGMTVFGRRLRASIVSDMAHCIEGGVAKVAVVGIMQAYGDKEA